MPTRAIPTADFQGTIQNVYEGQPNRNKEFSKVHAATFPVDLTDAVIDAQIIRRTLSNVKDSRYGLSFDIGNYTPTPTSINLSITNRDDATGTFTLLIDDSAWGLISSDVAMAINDVNGAGFSGRIKISFPSIGSTPPEDNIIFLFFIVRSDAIVKV